MFTFILMLFLNIVYSPFICVSLFVSIEYFCSESPFSSIFPSCYGDDHEVWNNLVNIILISKWISILNDWTWNQLYCIVKVQLTPITFGARFETGILYWITELHCKKNKGTEQDFLHDCMADIFLTQVIQTTFCISSYHAEHFLFHYLFLSFILLMLRSSNFIISCMFWVVKHIWT